MKPSRTILISTDAIGGVWTYSLAIAKGFSDAGWQVVLAVLGPAPDAGQRASAECIRFCSVVQTGLDLDWTVRTETELMRIADGLSAVAGRFAAHAAHLHAPCLADGGWHIPVVCVVHSCVASWWNTLRPEVLPAEFLWHQQASARGLSRAQAVVAPSRSFADAVRRVYATDTAIQVVHNGTAKNALVPATRQDFVLTAGRLWDEAKNMATLDRAAARMSIPVRAAGPVCGPHGATCSTPNLEVLGTLPEIFLRMTMARAAAFAAPSRYEPFGLAVLEAATLGTPLVLADIPTFRELWDGAALFVAAEDEDSWASTLTRVVAEPALRAELGRAAQRRATRYTHDAMVEATVDIHRRLPQALLQAA